MDIFQLLDYAYGKVHQDGGTITVIVDGETYEFSLNSVGVEIKKK